MPEAPQKPSSLLALGWREVGGMVSLLTDLGFRRFVTPRLVRTIYLLSLVAAGIGAFTWVRGGFAESFSRGLFTLVTGPLAFLLYALVARVGLEFVLAVIRIAENTDKMVERQSPTDSKTNGTTSKP